MAKLSRPYITNYPGSTMLVEVEPTAPLAIGHRIAELRGQESQASFAKKVGIHKNSLARYEKGDRTLDVELLGKFAQVTNARVEWLATGEGPMLKSQAAAVAPLDHDVMRDVVVVVEEFLRERGLVLNPEKKAELLILLYEDIREHEGKVDRAKVIRLLKLVA